MTEEKSTPEAKEDCRQYKPSPSGESFSEKQIEAFNRTAGDLTDYECQKCHGKGVIMISYDPPTVRRCDCVKVRKCLKRIEKSGLKPLIESYTLETYKDSAAWQKNAKNMASSFLNNFSGVWFFAGGQSGSGKSHLCTAIVVELLKKGHAAYYMMWRDEAVKLKANVNDETYSTDVKELQCVEILYIDDLFKGSVTQADINLAFQILNYRYINNLTTVISSELDLSGITQIDEAIAGRILEKAKGHTLIIPKDPAKNYRAKSVKNLF